MKKQIFTIKGTHCPSCKKLIEKRVGKIDGVARVAVDFGTGRTEIAAERTIAKDEVQNTLEGMGYQVL